MDSRFADLDNAVPLQALLGFLNFSEGKPDARFQKQLNDAFGYLAEHGSTEPWQDLGAALRGRLTELGDQGPFRDAAQARAVLELVYDHVLPAYRRHHADLLFHLSDRELFQPFFLARVFEAVLAQGGPWNEPERLTAALLRQLNDYVGYRPIAVLESRPQGEPYDHERVRPIPLYLRGVGATWGRYRELVAAAMEVLQSIDADLRGDASFDFDLMDELALDPRAYDHNHPVNRRPNYVFGEWDPHQIDGHGRYRRFVIRAVTLEGLLERIEQTPERDRAELLYEASAVLAGTILMGAGVSGSGPTALEATTSLSTLHGRIARYRDAFYDRLLAGRSGPHADQLKQEQARTRQPFGGVRQHLTHYLAGQRAAQMQQRHLALLLAEMGYPEAGRRQAAQIPSASIRILSEIQGRLTTGQLLVQRGQLASAARLVVEVEDLLHRGIACGALVDPWNILGFQGLFPLSAAQEDGMHDTRIDELIQVMAALFNLYDRLLSEAACAGDQELGKKLLPKLRRLAAWWDRFATVEVSDVMHVHGSTAATSAEHVAAGLAAWHARGEASADLAFWREQLPNFRSPKAFALVVDALLRKHDYQAAMALLLTWVGQAELVPLEELPYSFHDLALRWLLGVLREPPVGAPAGAERHTLVRRFFDHLEANAEDYWQVPVLDLPMPEEATDDDEELFDAAYEDVTYRDSSDDGRDEAVFSGAEPVEFSLEQESDTLGRRLRFLATIARLWHIAVQGHIGNSPTDVRLPEEVIVGWRTTARSNYQRLGQLLDALHGIAVPEPPGTYDALVEYDRQRSLKENLLYQAIHTCHDTFLALSTLTGVCAPDIEESHAPPWGPLAAQLEQAMLRGDAASVRKLLPGFLALFRQEPLLFTALADGGLPRQVLRVRCAQTILRALAIYLPRLGLLRETYQLLRTARTMEQAQPVLKGVSQFNELFQSAFMAVVETVVEAAPSWGSPVFWALPAAIKKQGIGSPLADLLEKVAAPFLKLWNEHSQTLRLAHAEGLHDPHVWEQVSEFIRRYGRELFHVRFMTLANLRGILHRGAGPYFDYLRDNPDPLHPLKLIDDLERGGDREQATANFERVLYAIVESYEEYKDYKATSTQSDYGENLYTLLDFLRLKSSYERQAWNLRPLLMVHEVLVRKRQYDVAELWRVAFEQYTQVPAEQHARELSRLEQAHALRLRTVADRIQERFVKALDLDRLCSLVQPAMDEAEQPEHPTFDRLEGELQPYARHPAGVGLDVPAWLRRVEREVHRVWETRSALAALAEQFARVPRRPLTFADLERQLREWTQPELPG